MSRRRLDVEMVRRGLTASRSLARAAIEAGVVTVAGAPATKGAALVAPDEAITILGPVRRFVSRGGEKLAAALDRFGIDPSGLACLDAGASTGGFTDCLLQRGAARVVALDVGYGQLAWSLRTDPRVIPMERTNVRALEPGSLLFQPDLVVADLSFISLRLAVPPLARVARDGAIFLMLVKPQFEATRSEVGTGGVVRDALTWRRALESVSGACRASGLAPAEAMPSPAPGPAGNVEFILHAVKGGEERDLDLETPVREGRRLVGAA